MVGLFTALSAPMPSFSSIPHLLFTAFPWHPACVHANHCFVFIPIH